MAFQDTPVIRGHVVTWRQHGRIPPTFFPFPPHGDFPRDTAVLASNTNAWVGLGHPGFPRVGGLARRRPRSAHPGERRPPRAGLPPLDPPLDLPLSGPQPGPFLP